MWSTQRDRERAERQYQKERIERMFPAGEQTVVLAIRVNPREAYLNSPFAQERVDKDKATIADVITDDVAALLESDGITDSENVKDISQVLQTARRLLHNSLSKVGYAYKGLTAEEKALITPTEFTALVDWLTHA